MYVPDYYMLSKCYYTGLKNSGDNGIFALNYLRSKYPSDSQLLGTTTYLK